MVSGFIRPLQYRLVGEGDDRIHDWNTPISDYKVLLNAYSTSEEAKVAEEAKEGAWEGGAVQGG